MMKKRVYFILAMIFSTGVAGAQHVISGSVKDAETREPLFYATVQWPGAGIGTTTDASGNFSLTVPSAAGRLIVSYMGYGTDTIDVHAGQSKYTVFLRQGVSALREVLVISGTMKEVTKMESPIPVEIYTPALFYKNPTPSIFEALGMVNGVQPQLNCNVCNTGDIHINGMEGPYTMVLIDGMPIVSSLSTVYGLAGIPNSIVKRIEVVKGPASTLYGSEAVGGLINIITKEPTTASRFQTDVSATTMQEYNADISGKWGGQTAQTLVGINYFHFANEMDVNKDNFTDVTQQQRISIFNKWDFNRRHNRLAAVAGRYVYEDRWGGELQWAPKYRGSSEVYGESIYTNRVELIGNYQLPLREKIFVDVSYNYHLQDSYYGINKFLADQHVTFGQIRWDKRIGKHDLLLGIPFRYTYYDDNTVGTSETSGANKPMNTYLPGVFAQDEVALSARVTMLAGFRYDHHNHHGDIFSPRLSFKLMPNKSNTVRISGGNGFRVVNLFTEDHAALTGARNVIIKNALKPEQSWNVNVNYATNIQHDKGFVGLDLSGFYTYFTNKIVGDFLTDPESIYYDNLLGHAISKGVTINTEFAFTNSFKILGGVTLMDVYQVDETSGEEVKTPQLFAPKVSGTYSVSYSVDRYGLTFDLTGRFNGPMHLPTVPSNGDTRPSVSPTFTIVNFQMSKRTDRGWEFYGGLKNILNFMPKDPIFYWQDPSAPQFDTTYNYAPVQGIKGFAGVRYTIQ